jgi:hypothetical protein
MGLSELSAKVIHFPPFFRFYTQEATMTTQKPRISTSAVNKTKPTPALKVKSSKAESSRIMHPCTAVIF